MSFMSLILKNLFRQRMRTVLTILGISIGITTVVALGVVTESFTAASGALIQFGGADFMVAQKGAADLAFSTVTVEDWDEVAARPDVEIADGVLMNFSRVGSNPFFVTFGRDPQIMAGTTVDVREGRLIDPLAPGEAMVGNRAASKNGFEIGDILTIEQHGFTIVGVSSSGNLLEDGGAYVPASTGPERSASSSTCWTAASRRTPRSPSLNPRWRSSAPPVGAKRPRHYVRNEPISCRRQA